LVKQPFVPDRGDVIWINLNPQAGHEQAGKRPAFVLSPAAYNAKTSLVIVCPITSAVKQYPFEVVIPAGFPITGVILSDQVKSLDWRARKATPACLLPIDVVTEVQERIAALIIN